MSKKVPFFNYPQLFLEDRVNYLRIIDDVASRGAFIMQDELVDFEKNLAKFIGSKYSIGVANATDGLEIAWMSIGLKDGDEIICSSHTMVATASAIKLAGGIPVPVDIGNDNLIDPEAIKDSINSRTVGIMPTQLNGRTCDMDEIMKIAEKNHLYVVEDSAQALGSKFKGKNAGTFGNAAAISFYPAKVLGCFGDAGALITNDDSIFKKAFQLHDHGRNPDGEMESWGRNSRLDNINAALLDYKLSSYNHVINRRREIASIYNNNLSEIEELKLPPSPDADDDHFDIYQNYELQAFRRDELREYLSLNGIGTLIQWGGKAIHQWKCLGFDKSLPKVETFFKNCIMLPMNTLISDEDVNYVCEKIICFYRD